MKIHAVGGAGGAGQSAPGGQAAPGGLAGLVDAPVSVTSGETLYVEVGGDGQPSGAGGWNGGGNGGPTDGGGGGGASDVRTVSCGGDCTGAASQASRLIVAGGGGGGGGFSGGAGGDAGSDGSFDGIDLAVTGGGAGTLAAGGGGGQEPIADDSPGQPGQAGYGGVGGTNDPQVYDIGQGGGGVGYAPGTYPGGGGGGGGGYYGGGGGGGGGAGGGGPTIGGGGGGGGSSYATGEVADGVSSGTLPAVVEISYTLQHAFTSTQAVSFSTQPQATLSASESVTLTNIGGAPLHVTGLLFSGADAGDFLVTSDDCRGNYLSPGLTEPANDSCVINVAFAPQAQGSRTGSLVIESNDPLGPTTVPLSGTGGPLPQGPAGSPGANGATGPQGPIGPQGPSATVVCQNTAVAKAICSITFAPGTWSLQRSTKTASFRISRSSRIVAQGKVKISHGRLILRPISQLSRGTYHLAILVGHGRGWKIAMRRTFTVN